MHRVIEKIKERGPLYHTDFPYPHDKYQIACALCTWECGSTSCSGEICSDCREDTIEYLMLDFTALDLLTFPEGVEEFICPSCGRDSSSENYDTDVALCEGCWQWTRKEFPIMLLLTRAIPLPPELTSIITGLMCSVPVFFVG
jgi:hypothetical protein